jgi:tight adherence protein C
VVVHPALALPVAGLVWGSAALPARRERARRAAEVRRHLPEAVDLLALAVGAGMTVPLAVAAVARRAPGPVGGELAEVVAETAAGRRLGDALALLPRRLGEDARPLAAALIASERDGAPLAEGLDRLASELRADRRRRAEEAARRVPVTLLFPLVSCILPAFALLTVAPLLAGALRALRP